jgi:potassium/hydrogen antiporter
VSVALGLTVDVTGLVTSTRLLQGLALAVILAVVARLAVGQLLMPMRLRQKERLFVIWGALRGGVPILLAAFALLAAVEDAERVYDIVFVVVAFSVIVQGSSIPFVARRLGIRMRQV